MRAGAFTDRLLGLPPAAARQVAVHADLAVPMRDGTVLRADRYVPDSRHDAPVVLVRSSYGRKGHWRWLYWLPLARRGYQVVVQSCRGTADSGGEIRPFDEYHDGHDTVAWLRAQPWYPGRFALFGSSYWGLTQWAMADAAPDELAAMTPSVTSAAIARSLYSGGALAQQTWLAWSAVLVAQEAMGPGLRALIWARTVGARRVARALRTLPLGRADRLAFGRTLPWWQEWVAHPEPGDPCWEPLDQSWQVPLTRAPVCMVSGWHDVFLPWLLADWAALPDGIDKRLVIGPWTHEHPALGKRYLQEAVAWLARHVSGRPGRLEGGPVRYYVTGAEQWRDAPTWPPPAADVQPWYLHAGGWLSPGEPSGGAPTRYRYDPADPTPVLGGPPAQRRPRVRQDKVEGRPDVVTFTSDGLRAPVEVIGPVGARVHLRSSAEHTDVVVRLCDVDRKGRSFNLCEGIQRVTPGQHPADHDGVRRIDVVLWPTAHRFASGHRIRLQVASAAFPWFARNPGTGEPPATATRLVAADQEVLHEPGHASHVVLPVAPSGSATPESGARLGR